MWLSEAEKIADSGIKADNKSQRHRLWEDLLTLYDYQQDLSLDFDQEEHYAIKKMETATKGVGSTKDFNIETTARDLANKYMSIEKYDKAYKMLMYLKNYNDTNYTHSPFVQNKKDRRTSDNLLYLTQSLQSYYMDLGNYKKAEEIIDMEHSMIEALRKKGDNSLGQQQLNNNLSLLSIYTNSCKTKDDWRHCLKLCDNLSKWSSQHLMKQFGTDNDWRSLNYVVPVLFKKRYVLMQLDDYDGAIRCIGTLDSIMNLYPSMFPKQERLRQQFNLYNCYRLKGDTLRSNALLDDISRKAGQIENIDWQLSTNILFANASRSIEEVFNGRPVSDDDIKTINLISDRLTSIVKYNFQFMTYTERTNFWNGWSAWFQTFIPNMAFADRDGRLLPLAYNSALLGKNILLNSEMEIADIVAKSGDTSLQYAYKKLLDDKAALSQAIQGKSKNADELGDKVDNEERELIKRSVALDDYTKRLTMDWTAVRDNLKGGEAAVEFMSCKGKDNTEAYLALIVTHSCKAPKIVRLNLQDLLNELSSNELYTTDTLYAVLWVPVIDAIGDKKLTTIYFSPVSHLHSTAIEYAPMPDGKPINSKYNIFRLSSTREVALMERAKDKKPRSLSVLYGGLDYGASPSAIATENKRQGYREMPGYAFTANDSTLRAGVSFLPGAFNEVLQIRGIVEGAQWPDSTYMQTHGTEESFKNLSSRHPSVLHIATHGFYWEEPEDTRYRLILPTMMDNMANSDIVSAEDRTLTHSGLLMAGANTALTGKPLPDNMDDGILTAQEISLVDLSGLDLVVLSACQSGMGAVSGDGVFGLQRGFKKAGANTLVMSLWNVNDKATQILMSEFYRNLVKGESKRLAFVNAQQYLRTIDDGAYDRPKFWAAFILLDALK